MKSLSDSIGYVEDFIGPSDNHIPSLHAVLARKLKKTFSKKTFKSKSKNWP